MEPDDERRVEELLRVNAELAAEIRNLTLGRAVAPRSSLAPASRQAAKLVEEKNALAAQLEAARAERDALERHNRELGRHIHELDAEVRRLRSGVSGLARRAWARILRS